MNRKLTQPEEIDQALKEITEEDMRGGAPLPDTKPLTGTADKSWSGAYVSPYRAEYIKSHNLPAQAELFR